MKELKKDLLDRFWSIYDTEGTIQALSWLESLKYYEEYCQEDLSDMADITRRLGQLRT